MNKKTFSPFFLSAIIRQALIVKERGIMKYVNTFKKSMLILISSLLLVSGFMFSVAFADDGDNVSGQLSPEFREGTNSSVDGCKLGVMYIKTRDVSDAGTGADVHFNITYLDDTVKHFDEDAFIINDGFEAIDAPSYDPGKTDTFVNVPIKNENNSDIKSIEVYLTKVFFFGSDWCPEWLQINGKTMSFQNATIKNGYQEDGYWWLEQDKGSALFDLVNCPSREPKTGEMKIHTADVSNAGTNSDMKFVLTFEDKSTIELKDDDCKADHKDLYERNHTDTFYRIPLENHILSPLVSVKIQLVRNFVVWGDDWCPDWIEINGKHCNVNVDKTEKGGGYTKNGRFWFNNKLGTYVLFPLNSF
ncbi:MAG: hypothetical protein HUJ62_07675 [Streptococcus gallolyticus]|nr:hypothetical protein [Streptococcus gallolyticus]